MTILRIRAYRQIAVAFGLGAVAPTLGCGSDASAPSPIAGSYTATVFRAVSSGQTVDVLAQGGQLRVVVSGGNATTGTLTIPASLNGGTVFTAPMDGTAVQTGGTVRFQQSADTFVRDLTWTVGSNTLSVTDQAAGGISFTITLTR